MIAPSDTAALVERLKGLAHSASEASKFLAAEKTARNREAGDKDALYCGAEPEQTTEWKAACVIEALSSALAETQARLAASDKVIWQDYHDRVWIGVRVSKAVRAACERHESRTSPPAAAAERGETT